MVTKTRWNWTPDTLHSTDLAGRVYFNTPRYYAVKYTDWAEYSYRICHFDETQHYCELAAQFAHVCAMNDYMAEG